MSATYVDDYPIGLVRPHPRNIRHEAIADDDMVASVASGGVDTPVTLGPADEDGIRYLIAGNRRYDAAIKAGVDTLPARFRDDLVTEQQQIEAMIRENMHRQDLSVVEQAEAFEQLQLFGADVAAIQEITGVSRGIVKERLKLVALPDAAKSKLHAGDASIVDALALIEFEDDHELHAELVAALGTSDFGWKARNARDTFRRRTRNAEKVAEFVELGAAAADAEDNHYILTRFHDLDLRNPAAHTHSECLGYRDYGDTSYQEPVLVCLAPDAHDDAPSGVEEQRRDDTRQQAESDARAEERERQQAERAAAAAVRIDAIRVLVAAALPAKGKAGDAVAAIAKVAVPSLLHSGNATDAISTHAYDAAFGFEVEYWKDRQEESEAYALDLTTAGTPAAVAGLVSLLTALIADALTHDLGADGVGITVCVWDWLEASGYQLSSIDEQVRNTALGGGDDE